MTQRATRSTDPRRPPPAEPFRATVQAVCPCGRSKLLLDVTLEEAWAALAAEGWGHGASGKRCCPDYPACVSPANGKPVP
jgi:hypothetical protein